MIFYSELMQKGCNNYSRLLFYQIGGNPQTKFQLHRKKLMLQSPSGLFARGQGRAPVPASQGRDQKMTNMSEPCPREAGVVVRSQHCKVSLYREPLQVVAIPGFMLGVEIAWSNRVTKEDACSMGVVDGNWVLGVMDRS